MQNYIAKIHLQNIQRNARTFYQITGKPLCAVVKADGYGHGAIEVVNALSGIADCFAVSLLREALEIQTVACGKDVLVFTPPMNGEEVRFGAEHGFVLSVTDYAVALQISKTALDYRLPVRVHLKVNTGMNRYGMNLQTLGKACALLCQNPFVSVEGLYSHLYGTTRESAENQRLMFLRAKAVCEKYVSHLRCHLSATYGALLGERFAFDMTRIGLGLYGYLPPVDEAKNLRLEKGMTVYAPVTATRKYLFGGAGYGKPLSAPPKDGRLYTLRIGYADGVLRQRDNGIHGYTLNAGTTCMDACVRMGKERKGRLVPVMIDADETAKVCGTIAYDTLCSITKRATRIYEN